MGKEGMITSAIGRFVRLGGLAGRVGASVVGNQIAGLARSDAAQKVRRTENLVRNAKRVVETLGELKGAAMKVGQMLSLHEGIMPPEVADVLRALQKEAPKVPAEVMEYEIRGSLERFDELFKSLDLEAFAAASIGQVHRGVLKDGREVAVKIQYPLIEEIVKADLSNLRALLKALLALISDIDFEPVWSEVRDRLLEELDYTNEARNVTMMKSLWRDLPEVVVPDVVPEATARNVLTMEYRGGLSPAEACSDAIDQELKDRWGTVLFDLLLRGIFVDRRLHADPNLANFAFLEDGRVIVYDFGCVKEVPEPIARGYAGLMLAVAEGREPGIPSVLYDMGVRVKGTDPVPLELTDPYAELLAPIARAHPPYTFGEDEDMYRRIFEIGLGSWSQALDLSFPQDIVFIDRTLAGHFGNLIRLHATGPWRELIVRHAGRAAGRGAAEP